MTGPPQTPRGTEAAIRAALTSLDEPLASELLTLDEPTALAVYDHTARRLRGVARKSGLDAIAVAAYPITLSSLRQAQEAAS